MLFGAACAVAPPRFLALALALTGSSVWAVGPAEAVGTRRPAATPLAGLRYTNAFFPGTTYRAAVPTPEAVLGFGLGDRAASVGEIERCLKAWTQASPDRTRWVEYARSHEGRPLSYVVVTAPTNANRLDRIQEGLARLGDPRRTTDDEAAALIRSLPAVAWLGYTVHGDETEGSDAALALLYHLIAAEDAATARLLEALVVVVDPVMNPDGRDRFVKMIAENRGVAPNVDDQSLVHDGYWPYGRGNHYLYDLNRDYLWAAHPETRGRLHEIGRWLPQLVVDAHGMGSQATHLFSPPREPINPYLPEGRRLWAEVFAADQARAFDRHGLLYYNGEWNEEWYPGYTDAWASFRGAVGILYEQARVAEDGVRRPEGRILTYRESMRHHVIGSMANLLTLQAHASDLMEHLYATRKSACATNGVFAGRTYAIWPTANRSRVEAFVDLLQVQGIEVYTASSEFTAAEGTGPLGTKASGLTVPAGAVLVPARQPLGHLIATMLDPDVRFSGPMLAEERRELLQKGRSRVYDTTAWNLAQMYGLELWVLGMEPAAGVEPWPAAAAAPMGSESGAAGVDAAEDQSAVAYVVDGASDASVAVAARLMEQGVRVRVAEKPFVFGNRAYARGSVAITALDNRTSQGDWRASLHATARDQGLQAVPILSGFGPGDLPDLGGRHFQLLEPPRIGLFSRGHYSANDYGAIWYTLDHRLGIRHSHLEEAGGNDLSRYNVLIVPDRWGRSAPETSVAPLKEWVRAGGTLVVIGNSTASVTSEKAELSKVRPLPDVLGRLADYELAVLREWLGRQSATPPEEAVWARTVRPGLTYPWQIAEGAFPDEKELKKRDAWQTLFMPQGALLASRADTNHWLTLGCGEWLPVLVGRQPVLMAGEGVEAPIRYGVWRAATPSAQGAAGAAERPADRPAESGKSEKKEPPRVGWCALPEGVELHLRLSGLLWPEAAHRLANAAYVTRESLGRGQVILFATPPTFRSAARGTERVFLNAVVYGPGFGAAPAVRP